MDGMSRVFPVRVSPSFGLIDGWVGWVGCVRPTDLFGGGGGGGGGWMTD